MYELQIDVIVPEMRHDERVRGIALRALNSSVTKGTTALRALFMQRGWKAETAQKKVRMTLARADKLEASIAYNVSRKIPLGAFVSVQTPTGVTSQTPKGLQSFPSAFMAHMPRWKKANAKGVFRRLTKKRLKIEQLWYEGQDLINVTERDKLIADIRADFASDFASGMRGGGEA